MGIIRRILFILDKTLHLGFHLCHVFSGNLTQDDVRIGVAALQLSEVVVGLVAAYRRGGELCVVAHDNDEGQVMFAIIVLDEGFYGIGIVACDRHRDDFSVETVPDFPIGIGLHGRHEFFRRDDENVPFLGHRCATQTLVVQELGGIYGIESAVVLLGGGNRSRSIERHFHRH